MSNANNVNGANGQQQIGQMNNMQNSNYVQSMDYGQLMQLQGTSLILDKMVSYLFNNGLNVATIKKIIPTFILIVTLKHVLDESKSYLESFKIGNITLFKFMYQKMKIDHKTIEMPYNNSKWYYNGQELNSQLLMNYFNRFQYDPERNSSAYMHVFGYITNVVSFNKMLTITYPNVRKVEERLQDEFEKLVIKKVDKVTQFMLMQPEKLIPKFVNTEIYYAYETFIYRKLFDIIKKYMDINKKVKFKNQPITISFNGPPGTGKTSFANYFAQKDMVDYVLYVNMMSFTNLQFDEMIKLINSNSGWTSKDKRNTILIVVDEVDKYMRKYIGDKIAEMKKDKVEKVEVSNEKGQKEMTEKITKVEVTSEQEKAEEIRIKEDFCHKLQVIVDGSHLTNFSQSIIIFNTNNFETMFEGVSKHYDALLTRFRPYKFDDIGKRDIVGYVEDIFTRAEIDFDRKLLDQIDDDIKISYRALTQQMQDSCFEIDDLINRLKNYNPILNPNEKIKYIDLNV